MWTRQYLWHTIGNIPSPNGIDEKDRHCDEVGRVCSYSCETSTDEMFSTKLKAVTQLRGCLLVRRDFLVELSDTYRSGLLECVGKEGKRWCHSRYFCRSSRCLGLSLVD